VEIRNYRPGDEEAQAAVYNAAAGRLPGFKPAAAEDVSRRYTSADPDPTAKFYAVEGDRVIGYATFNANGRLSYPWCLPEAPEAREPLFAVVLAAMARRGLARAWATYRADWPEVLGFFERRGFARSREMVNYVAELVRLPRRPVPERLAIGPWTHGDLARLLELGEGLFSDDDPEALGTFFWENPYFEPDSLFALRRTDDGRTLGFGLAITNARYADPTKIDAAMPCFRLGALGTEAERHKRVSGLVSFVFESEDHGDILLSEAARRLDAAGLTHAAAQVRADRADLAAFYGRHFRRQGGFPILERPLGGAAAP
jgi:hypothetical protein